MRRNLLRVLCVLSVFCATILPSNASAATTTEIQDKVLQIYAGVWETVPDSEGLNYWTNTIQSGQFTYVDVSTSFFDQPLVKEKYSDGDGNPDGNVTEQAGNPGVYDACGSGSLIDERTWGALKAMFDAE